MIKVQFDPVPMTERDLKISAAEKFLGAAARLFGTLKPEPVGKREGCRPCAEKNPFRAQGALGGKR